VKKLNVTSHLISPHQSVVAGLDQVNGCGVGVDQLRSANDIQPEKIEARHKVLILRGTFFRFWSILGGFLPASVENGILGT
jgi:hypothetical protein